MFLARTIAAVILAFGSLSPAVADEIREREMQRLFVNVVHPFLQAHCFECHGAEEPEAKLELTRYTSINVVRRELGHWDTVRKRLEAGEMPPEDADQQPTEAQRRAVVEWTNQLRRHEAERNAGDPGPVLPRRLSNAEYNYSIRDLTGVDIRPTREFPVDPANEAGFDNSGESLAMSPALLKKYLAAARHVAEHLVLLPDGFTFAPHSAVIYSDRDKFCVHRIVDFYKRQRLDYADFFFAAWQHRHRAALGRADSGLANIAERDEISPKYLATVQAVLTGIEHNAGPLAELRDMWKVLPEPGDDNAEVRQACEQMRDFVLRERSKLVVPVGNFKIKGMHPSSQPLILWMNREISQNRRRGTLPDSDGRAETEQLRAAIEEFCSVFPDAFVVWERGRMFLPPEKRNKGRLLNAGFHLMLGYYRDDSPLYDLILDDAGQQELDRLWQQLDFVARAPTRQVQDFVYFERAESPQYLRSEEFDFAREDKDVTSEENMDRLAGAYIAKARRHDIDETYIAEIEGYFADMAAKIRGVEKARRGAQPSHLDSLLKFAERAWRRPLTGDEAEELLTFYRQLRDSEQLSHEEAVRDVLASVLISPRFCYRIDLPGEGDRVAPLSNLSLASRLSYFLWASLPDAELLAHAQTGELRNPEVLLAQSRRMLKDTRVRGLATEFGTNWLDVRRFEQHNGVNRQRFPSFTDELRQAMFEEPVRFFVDLMQRDGSVFDLLDGGHTFVNQTLAAHYGILFDSSQADAAGWLRVDDAGSFGRGGLLPMSVFLTKNSPGLRTSPVKRGYWVVRRLLGETIPPPPPEVPELPDDESQLGDVTVRQALAKHRQLKSCAACHERFDSMGLIFEGYGPIGERRTVDLGGRAVDRRADFPDGSTGEGVPGLQRYLREKRREGFIDNLGRKLLAYALGRGLLLSDELLIESMKARLADEDYRIGSLIESIVASPQFLNQRGRDFTAEIE